MNSVRRTSSMGIVQLQELARQCRRHIVRMIHSAGAGHPGGSLSAIDLLVALYGNKYYTMMYLLYGAIQCIIYYIYV